MVNDFHRFDAIKTGEEWIGWHHRNDSMMAILAFVIRKIRVVVFFGLQSLNRILVVHDDSKPMAEDGKNSNWNLNVM